MTLIIAMFHYALSFIKLVKQQSTITRKVKLKGHGYLGPP